MTNAREWPHDLGVVYHSCIMHSWTYSHFLYTHNKPGPRLLQHNPLFVCMKLVCWWWRSYLICCGQSQANNTISLVLACLVSISANECLTLIKQYVGICTNDSAWLTTDHPCDCKLQSDWLTQRGFPIMASISNLHRWGLYFSQKLPDGFL